MALASLGEPVGPSGEGAARATGGAGNDTNTEEEVMLWTIFVILLVLGLMAGEAIF